MLESFIILGEKTILIKRINVNNDWKGTSGWSRIGSREYFPKKGNFPHKIDYKESSSVVASYKEKFNNFLDKSEKFLLLSYSNQVLKLPYLTNGSFGSLISPSRSQG